jgi:stress-induced morphogen
MPSLHSTIENIVQEHFEPVHAELINESHGHNVAPGSETHFKLICVAEAFDGMNKVKRHQVVYSLLQPCFEAGLHALSLHLQSPDEWRQSQNVPESPPCMGGSKHNS